MKRTISLLLAVIMVLTGCSQPQTQNPSTDSVADIVPFRRNGLKFSLNLIL